MPMQVHKSKISLVTGTQMDHDDLIGWMKERHMVRKPCEALARPHVQRTADDALSHAEGVALCPRDRAVIDILLAMRPHITNMSAPPYIIVPNQPALVPSAETVRYELALISVHMPFMLVNRDGNQHLLFRVRRSSKPSCPTGLCSATTTCHCGCSLFGSSMRTLCATWSCATTMRAP